MRRVDYLVDRQKTVMLLTTFMLATQIRQLDEPDMQRVDRKLLVSQ